MRSARHAENRDFGPVHDRREIGAADAAEIRDRHAAAAHLLERELPLARLRRQLVQLDGNRRDVLLIGVSDHRHQQPAIGVDGDADVDVFLVDDLAALRIDRRVELRKLLDGRREHFHEHRGDRQVPASLLDRAAVLRSQLLERRDVGLVELRYVRNRVPRVAEMLGGRTPDVAPGLPLDLSPLLEVRQRASARAAPGGCAAPAEPTLLRIRRACSLTSSREMRPAGPVPWISLMSTPISRARRRTEGDAGAAGPRSDRGACRRRCAAGASTGCAAARCGIERTLWSGGLSDV